MTHQTCWLIEDNPADAELFTLSMEGSPLLDEITWFEAAHSAIEALNAGQRPSLIILDLNMPGISGHDFLEHIKTSDMSTIPVIVWTSSKASVDISKSYELHANCCLNKPTDYGEMAKVARSFRAFWLDLAILP